MTRSILYFHFTSLNPCTSTVVLHYNLIASHGIQSIILLLRVRVPRYSTVYLQDVEVTLERNHRISIVGNDSSQFIQEWNRSRNLVRGQESKDTKHGQSSIVDLSLETLRLRFLALILVETKGIVKVQDEVDIVPKRLCGGVLSRSSSGTVMLTGSISLSTTGLTVDFQQGDSVSKNVNWSSSQIKSNQINWTGVVSIH